MSSTQLFLILSAIYIAPQLTASFRVFMAGICLLAAIAAQIAVMLK